MHLSNPKLPSKFNKSLDIPKFGRPIRSPRTPSSSLQSYSDTFDDVSQKMPNYSDTFVSESHDPTAIEERTLGMKDNRSDTEVIETMMSDTPRHRTSTHFTTEIPTERLDTVISETEPIETLISDTRHHRTSTHFTTEIPTERLDTVISEYIETERPRTMTVGIETCISELDTDQMRTVTERVESPDSGTERLHTLSSKSAPYTYSDTFLSGGENNEDDLSYTQSDETVTRSEYSDTHTVDYSGTSASGTLTDEGSISASFEEYTLSSEISERYFILEL